MYDINLDFVSFDMLCLRTNEHFLILTGVKVLFRVSLVLFKYALGRPEQLVECPTLYEIMEQLRHLPAECLQEEVLCHEVSAIKVVVSEEDQLSGFKDRSRPSCKCTLAFFLPGSTAISPMFLCHVPSCYSAMFLCLVPPGSYALYNHVPLPCFMFICHVPPCFFAMFTVLCHDPPRSSVMFHHVPLLCSTAFLHIPSFLSHVLSCSSAIFHHVHLAHSTVFLSCSTMFLHHVPPVPPPCSTTFLPCSSACDFPSASATWNGNTNIRWRRDARVRRRTVTETRGRRRRRREQDSRMKADPSPVCESFQYTSRVLWLPCCCLLDGRMKADPEPNGLRMAALWLPCSCFLDKQMTADPPSNNSV